MEFGKQMYIQVSSRGVQVQVQYVHLRVCEHTLKTDTGPDPIPSNLQEECGCFILLGRGGGIVAEVSSTLEDNCFLTQR